MNTPTFQYEKQARENGFQVIAGVDEAGAGAWAGPVIAAAVVLPFGETIKGVRDSKLLSVTKRAALYDEILERAHAWAVGGASPQEIDVLNIRQATYLAMRRAVTQIKKADYVLVDAWTIPELSVEQQGIVKGDQQVTSIAAASIVAKVTRDRMMADFARQFPHYGFDQHKGYGTKKHREAIDEHGLCTIHRTSYRI